MIKRTVKTVEQEQLEILQKIDVTLLKILVKLDNSSPKAQQKKKK